MEDTSTIYARLLDEILSKSSTENEADNEWLKKMKRDILRSKTDMERVSLNARRCRAYRLRKKINQIVSVLPADVVTNILDASTESDREERRRLLNAKRCMKDRKLKKINNLPTASGDTNTVDSSVKPVATKNALYCQRYRKKIAKKTQNKENALLATGSSMIDGELEPTIVVDDSDEDTKRVKTEPNDLEASTDDDSLFTETDKIKIEPNEEEITVEDNSLLDMEKIKSESTKEVATEEDPILTDNEKEDESIKLLRDIRRATQTTRHPTKMFFDSMATTVMSFPPALAAEAKLKVCQIVTELECRMLNDATATDVDADSLP